MVGWADAHTEITFRHEDLPSPPGTHQRQPPTELKDKLDPEAMWNGIHGVKVEALGYGAVK